MMPQTKVGQRRHKADPEISGKTVVVTGGAYGIGASVAKYFATCGAKVYATDIEFSAAAKFAQSTHDNIVPREINVTNPEAVNRLMEEIESAEGCIDILVNNADLIERGQISNSMKEDRNSLVSTNLGGMFTCVEAASRNMSRRKAGAIINILSLSAFDGHGALGNAWKAAIKAGAMAMSKSLALELRSHKVRVNAIVSSVVETDTIWSKMSASPDDDSISRFSNVQLASVSDINQAVSFLSSDLATFITGETLTFDGLLLKS